VKKIVIIGANDFQDQLVRKAKSLGYETHCFAWQEDAVAKESADYFYPISVTQKEEILEICRTIRPDGVCTIASDLAVLTADYVAENLGLPCNAYADTLIATNKYRMREAFAAAGVSVPKFLCVDKAPTEAQLEGFAYPLIVKPTDRSGSRCITKIDSFSQIEEAVRSAVAVSFERKAIIEEYIEGDEYSCECISYKGKHHFLAFTKKFTTGAPNYIETGHIQPSDIPISCQKELIETVYRALDALHIQNGASHTEFKLGADMRCRIIETGPRMGGDCIGSDLVYLSTGHDFMKMVIDVACGEAPTLCEKPAQKVAEIRFIFTHGDIEELERIRIEQPTSLYRISEIDIDKIGHITDSGSRAGYYILA